MEKAILKTLIYADIFDYPLTIREIHKWLIGKSTEPRKIEKALEVLSKKGKVKKKRDLYYLRRREEIISLRIRRKKHSYIYIKKATAIAWILKIVPWIRLVGISGGLAMENAGRGDDIDLFLVVSKNRLWISRLLILGILNTIGQRRKKDDSKKEAAGKICCNIILEEDRLEQERKDLYTAHEVLQMKVLWQRGEIYQKYLEENNWAFKYLPNWIGDRIMNKELRIKQKRHNSLLLLLDSIISSFEKYARILQLNLMKKPKGMERIGEGALYFHPEDYRKKVLEVYKRKINSLSTT